MPSIDSIPQLVAACIALGVEDAFELTESERELVQAQEVAAPAAVDPSSLMALIQAGADPLGEAYASIKSPLERRPMGQTYTPDPIVQSMVAWASNRPAPARVVDPGAGSGRYLLAAARAFPNAALIGMDIDPLATLMLRANLVAAGEAARATVILADYRSLALSELESPTLFIGNPPYVRHHEISEQWKSWFSEAAVEFGVKASKLAGLHIHFFVATAKHARRGDYGAFITSAEWLDVNYGATLRQLLLGQLGGSEIHVLEPEVEAFPDAQTTAAITCFEIGEQPETLTLRRVPAVEQLGQLAEGRQVSRTRLADSNRWSVLTRTPSQSMEGYIELGELCRVHRGAVTGANKAWVAAGKIPLPESVLFPSITKARELFSAGERLSDTSSLKRVIDLPIDLDVFEGSERRAITRFLSTLKKAGVPDGYVAANRKAWWSVGLKNPAPILATYMARRPPAFVLNEAQARHINIAHGLYPRQELGAPVLHALSHHLRNAVQLSEGRVYAGGLTKFEPREMERLLVPDLDTLMERTAQ